VKTLPRQAADAAPAATIWRRLSHGALARHEGAHATLLLGANLLAGLCIYLMHSVLGHLLGPTAYGTFAALIALSSVLLMPTHVIATAMTKHGSALRAAGHLPHLNDLIRRLTALLLPLGFGAMALFMGASGYIATFFHLDTSGDVLPIGLLFAVSFVTPINVGVLLGLQRFSWYGALVVVPVFLRFALASAFVLLGHGLVGAIVGIALADGLTYVISFRPLRDLLAGPRLPSGSLRPFGAFAAHAIVVFAGLSMLSNLDTLLARHVLSAQQAGLYAALATAGKVLFFVSGTVVTVMFPRVAAAHERGERATRAIRGAVVGVCLLSLPVELAFVIRPTLVMRVMFGPSFDAAAGQLAWYGLAMLLLAVAVVFVYYFLAINEQRIVLPLALCCLAQGALFSLRHASIAQVVQNVVVSNGLLFVGLLIFVTWHTRRNRSL